MSAFLRTTLLSGLLLGAGMLLYSRISGNDLRRTIHEMEALQAEMEQRVAAREAMIERLNRKRRLAHLRITDQSVLADGEVASTELLFIELDESGRELARQPFTVPGNVLFIDALTVKFHGDDVAAGHPLRGRTLLLLRRIYSDRMPPIDGYPIDTPGAVPPGYGTGEAAEFEVRVWKHFWELATDPDLAAELGVRVAQGEAVYKPVDKGRAYELVVDAAGGMSLTPLPPDDVALSP